MTNYIANIRAMWKCNDNTGFTTVENYYGTDAFCSSNTEDVTTTSGVPAYLTRALDLNGADNIDCASTVSDTTDIAVVIVGKFDSTSGDQYLFTGGSDDLSNDGGYNLWFFDMFNTMSFTTGPNNQIVQDSGFSDTDWHCWVVSAKESTKLMSLEKDGANVGGGLKANAVDIDSTPLKIGSKLTDANKFNGKVGFAAVFNSSSILSLECFNNIGIPQAKVCNVDVLLIHQ